MKNNYFISILHIIKCFSINLLNNYNTSPVTGKHWTTITNNMSLIDLTKNADEPKVKDLDELKRICKNK